MKIVNSEGLRILYPEDGYELINKATGIHSEIVYLGIMDKAENYIEVSKKGDSKAINNCSSNKEYISIARAVDNILCILDPIMGTYLGKDSSLDAIVNFYAEIVNKGLKDVKDVPNTFKDLVAKKLKK